MTELFMGMEIGPECIYCGTKKRRGIADEIKRVRLIESESDRLEKKLGHKAVTKITVVEFTDGTVERAVCSYQDTFELSMGIMICLAKHMAGGDRRRSMMP